MPIFDYVAIDTRGKQVRGAIEADSQALAINQVQEIPYFPTRVTERQAKAKTTAGKGDALQFQIKIPGLTDRVGAKQLTSFTRQLSTLIDAGLPLVRSLSVLRNQMKPSALKDILETISRDVEGGSTFSEALAKHPRAFSKLFVNMVKAGEIGGVLDTVLQRLAEFAEKSAALMRKIKGAMVYPIVVILVIIGVLAVIFRLVIPTFIEMFEDVEAALPPPTLLLIAIHDFLHSRQALLIPVALVGLIGLYKLVRRTGKGGLALDKVKLKIPIFGSLTQKLAVTRFSRTLGTLITSGVPILQALSITKETAENLVISRAISSVHDSIREGETIAGPLDDSGAFPPLVTSMIAVGEETGNLDQMLIKVADTYDDEVDTAVAGLASTMEPLLIIIMGLIVAFVVISIFLPLIQMAAAIG